MIEISMIMLTVALLIYGMGRLWLYKIIPFEWRWYHKIHARYWRYFWLPCPICDDCFGGHEIKMDHILRQAKGGDWCVCPKQECGKMAREISIENTGWEIVEKS